MSRTSDERRNLNNCSTGTSQVSYPCEYDMVRPSSHQNQVVKFDKSRKEKEGFRENKSLKDEKKHCSSKFTTTTANDTSKIEADDADRFKTELCRSWDELGRCKYGLRCKFAHGCKEIRQLDRHPRYKTTPCRQFHTRGFCSYGSRCHFIHGETDRLLLAFLLTAVELEKAKHGHSKSASKKNGDTEQKKSGKCLVNSTSSRRSPDLKVDNSHLQSIDTNRIHVMTEQNSNSTQQTQWVDDAIQNQFLAQQLLANNWNMGNISKLQNTQSKDGFEILLDKNAQTKFHLEDDLIASTLLINSLSDRFTDRTGFDWSQNSRSRTSSGESFGDDFDLSGIHSLDLMTGDEQLRQADVMEHSMQHQLVLSQRQVLEERLMDTLRRIQDLNLNFESSTNHLLSKPDNDSYGKIFDCFDAANAQLSGNLLGTRSLPLSWSRVHSIDSLSVSSGSPPSFHWTDLQLDGKFI